MTPLHPIMFAGTGSDVGKSIVATAFCRIFRQDGYHPAPFKAQNMALNSYATPEGLEIGRAQAVQAEAAGIACHTDMNPILLKPNSDHTSQVVLNGKPIGNYHAREYFEGEGRKETGGRRQEEGDRRWETGDGRQEMGGMRKETEGRMGVDRDRLREEAHAAFDRLAARYNPIVMEGAGSIAEINLKDRDLVNMSMAMYAKADVILVADIDRGGVFASVYGTLMLLSPEERKRVKGIIINKFRGDKSLFDEGRRMLEKLCGIPVLAVLPYFKDIHIEEEDSVSLELKAREVAEGKINIAVVMLRHLSNFTDFDALERDPRVHLFYTNNTEELQKADIIILPGSKNTIADLMELRRNGVAQAILRAHHDGTTVVGICGGYQMMGQEVLDPNHVEGDIERMPGLGLLPVSTTMEGEKRTVQTTFHFLDFEEECKGYEIHMGHSTLNTPHSTLHPPPSTLNTLPDGTREGTFLSSKCFGTYMHGILDNPVVVDYLLAPFAGKGEQRQSFDYAAYKEQQYDLLAERVRKEVDMDRLYKILSF